MNKLIYYTLAGSLAMSTAIAGDGMDVGDTKFGERMVYIGDKDHIYADLGADDKGNHYLVEIKMIDGDEYDKIVKSPLTDNHRAFFDMIDPEDEDK